jgi:uncharacterized membrane protein
MNNGTKLKWVIVVLAFCLLHLLIFTRVFYSGGPDVEGYYQYAVRMNGGQVAYRDFAVEYPPGALVVFYLPYLVSNSLAGYGTAFTFEMLVFDILGMLMILGAARRARISAWFCLVGYTLAMVAIGSIMVQRFDMIPAVMTLGALYAFSRGNYRIAWGVLAVGTVIKLVPGLMAPLFLIYQWKRDGLRSVIPGLAVFIAVISAVSLPFLAVSSHGFIASFTIQGRRPLQLESTYSAFLLILGSLGLISAVPVQGQISYDLASSVSGPLARYSIVFVGLGLLLVYGLFYRSLRGRKGEGPVPDSEMLAHLFNYSFVTFVVFLATNKVFSPQYLVWLYPLFPLVSGRLRSSVWVIFLTAACLTWYIYPIHYYDLVDTQQVPVDALFLRDTLIVFLAVLLLGESVPAAPGVPGGAQPETLMPGPGAETLASGV